MDLASSALRCPVGLSLVFQEQGIREAPECCELVKPCGCCGGWRHCAGSCFGCLSVQVVAVQEESQKKKEEWDGMGNPKKVNDLQASNFL